MTKKRDDTVFGYHAVCLVDVLGQKQRLANWRELPENGKLTPEFIAAIKKTVGTVLGFRDHFTALFEQFKQVTMPDKVAALTPEQQDRYRRLRGRSVLVERFSDTFVFSSQIGNANEDTSIAGIYDLLAACCISMTVSLASEVPVRGAVTVGLGAVLEDNSFYGPALAEAHCLESEVASYPRVVVSPTVLDTLAEGQAYSRDLVVSQGMRDLARMCRRMIVKDTDDNWIVDFLGPGIRGILGSDIAKSTVVLAYEFVRAQAEEFRQAGNSKLALRYDQLKRYMAPRIPLWDV